MIKIYIHRPLVPGVDTAKIYIIEELVRGTRCYYNHNGKYLVKTEIQEQGVSIPPFLELDSDFFNDFVQAFSDFANENNIKSKNENYLEGKLAATEKQLVEVTSNFNMLFNKFLKLKVEGK